MNQENNIEHLEEDSVDELDILQKVLSALQNLQPDARKRLLQTVATFFGIESIKSSRIVATEAGLSEPKFRSYQGISSFSEDRAMSPKEFLLEKQPRTDVERVACLAYYLTHYRDVPHFKTVDISKLNTEAAQRKFSNPSIAVDNAAKLGYLVTSTKGRKQLSATGEMFVQELPDYDAAKNVMAKARPRRKTKSTSKVKKQPKDG